MSSQYIAPQQQSKPTIYLSAVLIWVILFLF